MLLFFSFPAMRELHFPWVFPRAASVRLGGAFAGVGNYSLWFSGNFDSLSLNGNFKKDFANG